MHYQNEQTLNKFEKEMGELASLHGLEFRKKSLYHFHVKGVFLLNIYPTKNTVYVQGSNGKATYEDLTDLIALAKGEAMLEGVVKSSRKPHSRKRRVRIWKVGGDNKCFVCGLEFTNFEETTLEHKVPLCMGGSNRRDNLALSHEACNKSRGQEMAVNWRKT